MDRISSSVRVMYFPKLVAVWFLYTVRNVECQTPASFQDFYTETMLGQNRSNKYILDTLWAAAESIDSSAVSSDLLQCVKDLLAFKSAVFLRRELWSIKSKYRLFSLNKNMIYFKSTAFIIDL